MTFKGEVICSRVPKALCALGSYEIAMSWEKPVAFGIISIQGGTYSEECYFTKDKSGRELKSFDFMAVDRKLRQVIQTCTVDKAVHCFSFDGEPIFTFKNEELKEPRGVAVGCDSIIFVCNSIRRGSIFMLSQNGLLFKTIKEQCLECPLAIAVKGSRFAVSQAYTRKWDIIRFFTMTIQI